MKNYWNYDYLSNILHSVLTKFLCHLNFDQVFTADIEHYFIQNVKHQSWIIFYWKQFCLSYQIFFVFINIIMYNRVFVNLISFSTKILCKSVPGISIMFMLVRSITPKKIILLLHKVRFSSVNFITLLRNQEKNIFFICLWYYYLGWKYQISSQYLRTSRNHISYIFCVTGYSVAIFC